MWVKEKAAETGIPKIPEIPRQPFLFPSTMSGFRLDGLRTERTAGGEFWEFREFVSPYFSTITSAPASVTTTSFSCRTPNFPGR